VKRQVKSMVPMRFRTILVWSMRSAESRTFVSRVHAASPQGYLTGRLTPGLECHRVSKARFNGLTSLALADKLKLLIPSTLEAR
jgi:hypothetical protein